jgi:hypothetical protein
MHITIRSDILQLLVVTACCVSIAWFVRSPQQLARVLYAPKALPTDTTGNTSAKQGGNMGKPEAVQEINAAIVANKVICDVTTL